MRRIAAVFPGQGSQSVGMGVEVAAAVNEATALFERARDVLGYDLLALQREGPDELLRETRYSQPAIFTTNVALFTACADLHGSVVVSAGHSFGELCSLTVAEALSFDDALHIVDERGKAMQAAAEMAPGGMAAVLGLEADRLRPIVERMQRENGDRVQLANFNSPTQIVISGDLGAVQRAGEEMLKAGAKRVVPLNVSGAWHSELMRPAVERLAAAVNATEFSLPVFDVVSNVDAQPYRDVEVIKRNLVRSITHEVRWHETAERVLSYKPDLIVEFGASAVLVPLIKRLPDAPHTIVVNDMHGVASLRSALEAA